MGLSKSWEWEMLAENQKEYWRNPSEESYYKEAQSLFDGFEIVSISHVETYYTHDGKQFNSAHFHILIRK